MPGGRHQRTGSSIRLPAAASSTLFFHAFSNSGWSGGGHGVQPSLLTEGDAARVAASSRTQTPLTLGALGSPYQLTGTGGLTVGACAHAAATNTPSPTPERIL